MSLQKSGWVLPFGVAAVVSALTVWVVPIYQDGSSGELRTVHGTLEGEPAWLVLPLLWIVLFPLVVAAQLQLLGPAPRLVTRLLLAVETLIYGACAMLGMLMIALEGAIFTMSGGTMRADNVLVDAAAWATALWWTAVGMTGAVFVFRKW